MSTVSSTSFGVYQPCAFSWGSIYDRNWIPHGFISANICGVLCHPCMGMWVNRRGTEIIQVLVWNSASGFHVAATAILAPFHESFNLFGAVNIPHRASLLHPAMLLDDIKSKSTFQGICWLESCHVPLLDHVSHRPLGVISQLSKEVRGGMGLTENSRYPNQKRRLSELGSLYVLHTMRFWSIFLKGGNLQDNCRGK